MLQVFYRTVGIVGENTYVVVKPDKEALIFDPGAQGTSLIEWIESQGWSPKAILLTHAHFDHIGACDDLRQHYNIPLYIYHGEAHWLQDAQANGSQPLLGMAIRQSPADHLWKDDDFGHQSLASFDFEIKFIPGHSPGHVVYYFPSDGFVISGDTLFKDSIGRTDLPGGDYHTLMKGLASQLLILPEETKIYPGHGEATTIKRERRFNPYLQMLQE